MNDQMTNKKTKQKQVKHEIVKFNEFRFKTCH